VKPLVHEERSSRIPIANLCIETNADEGIVWCCPKNLIDNPPITLQFSLPVLIQNKNRGLPCSINSNPVSLRSERLFRTDVLFLDQSIPSMEIGDVVVMVI